MTKPKAESLGSTDPKQLVAWEDELVSTVLDVPDPELVRAGVPAHHTERFRAWFRAPLAAYLFHERAMVLRGQASSSIAWLEDAIGDLNAALADGRLHRPPLWNAGPALWHAAYKMGKDWDEILAAGDSVGIHAALLSARESLARESPKRGRPSSRERDHLLRQVVEWLRESGLPAAKARATASNLLIACRIRVPDEDSVPRAMRRVRQKGGPTT